MERRYWLGQQHASFMLAGAATSAEERLIHYHRAGIYSVRAAVGSAIMADNDDRPSAGPVADAIPNRPRPDAKADACYYRELSQGAAYLASQASDEAQAIKHDEWAANYARRAREAIWWKGPPS
jgi:hypothetical protein